MLACGVISGEFSRIQRTAAAVAPLSPISSSWKKIWATTSETLCFLSWPTTQATSGSVMLQLPGPESVIPPMPAPAPTVRPAAPGLVTADASVGWKASLSPSLRSSRRASTRQ